MAGGLGSGGLKYCNRFRLAQSAITAEYTASLQWGKTPHPNECPDNDAKQSDGEASVML